ncbi:type VI secretion system transmembrane protein TssO [Sphingobacterium sp. E70]|nr:type VI secretion system transmembrane protein TssO [Sphingobacterium sp. E70]ULT25608.1 type VI secretion system transmembrane protein TssO [Sphingobacterium sp. E70]
MIKLSLAERREHFLLLLGAFVLAMTILGFVLFYSDGPRFAISKEDLALRIQDDQKFEESAKMALRYVDSASLQIKRFDPSVQAVFIENDIKKHLMMSMPFMRRIVSTTDMAYLHRQQSSMRITMLTVGSLKAI